MSNNMRAVTRTLRIDEDVDRKLRALADREKLSVNVVASRALRRLVEWDSVAERLRFQSVSADMLQKMMEYIPEESARELGRWSVLNVARGLAPFKRESLEAEIASLEFLGLYSRRYRIDHKTTSNEMVLILTHHMGPKWSAFYEEVLRGVLEDHMGQEVKSYTVDRTENQVVGTAVLTKLAQASVAALAQRQRMTSSLE